MPSRGSAAGSSNWCAPFPRARRCRTVRLPPPSAHPARRRAVGQALGRNPFPIVIPCHRVLAAGGHIGGFTAQGGVSVKVKMLAAEGVTARVSTYVSTRAPHQSLEPALKSRASRSVGAARGVAEGGDDS